MPPNLGVDLGTGACLAGQTCSFGTTTNTFASTFYDNLEALVTYQQSGLGSVAAFTGQVTLTNASTVTPEPAPFVLLATGLGALVFLRVRRS